MKKPLQRVIDAEYEVVQTTRPRDHWTVIKWADMSAFDRIALVISWCCAIGVGLYWLGRLL